MAIFGRRPHSPARARRVSDGGNGPRAARSLARAAEDHARSHAYHEAAPVRWRLTRARLGSQSWAFVIRTSERGTIEPGDHTRTPGSWLVADASDRRGSCWLALRRTTCEQAPCRDVAAGVLLRAVGMRCLGPGLDPMLIVMPEITGRQSRGAPLRTLSAGDGRMVVACDVTVPSAARCSPAKLPSGAEISADARRTPCCAMAKRTPSSSKRCFMRRLNSRCTAQRPVSVQTICPAMVAIEPSTLSTPQSCRSLCIEAA